MDINELRRLLQSGQVGPDDIAAMGGQNALAQLMGGQPPMPQPRYDIAPMQQNTMRAENGPDMGKVTPLDFNRPAQQAMAAQQGAMGAPQAQQAPQQMQVMGAGNGTMVNLPPEQMQGRPNLDMSRAPVDVMGAKAYYSKDEPGIAYVMGPQGPKKVILGYDMQGSMALNKYNLDQQKTQTDIAHTQEETRASKANNPDFGASGTGPLNASLTGDAFLAQLDPMIANEVKSIANGDVPFNPRSQRQMNLLGLVQQANPNWSATDYQVKQQTQKDFAPGGKDSEKVRNLNLAVHHGGQVADAIGDLHNLNGILSPLNAPINAVESFFGNGAQNVYKEKVDALSGELRKVYAGAGGGTLNELTNWQSRFDPNASEENQRRYLQAGMELLQGGLASLKESYNRGMGPRGDFGKLVPPENEALLGSLLANGRSSGSPQTASPSAELNSPPLPAQYTGKRMQAPDGTIYKSDGTKWVRVS